MLPLTQLHAILWHRASPWLMHAALFLPYFLSFLLHTLQGSVWTATSRPSHPMRSSFSKVMHAFLARGWKWLGSGVYAPKISCLQGYLHAPWHVRHGWGALTNTAAC